MIAIGIDPGLTGAIAIVGKDEPVMVYDMPVMSRSKSKRQIDATHLASILRYQRALSNFTVFIEDVHAMPKQGVSSVFSFGLSAGIIEGVVAALGFPVELVSPMRWKQAFDLIGQPKDMARTRVKRWYPDVDVSLKKHVGRADAILIARYGLLKYSK